MQSDSHTTHAGEAKTAPPPKPMPSKKSKLDEDEAAPAPPKREKTLSTGLSRAIVIGTLIFSIAFVTVELLRDRYTIAPVPNSVNSFVYRLDRLTGSLQLCGAQQCTAVQVLDGE